MTGIALLQSSGAAGLIMNILPILAIGLVFYFLVIGPANKQRKQQQEMLSALKKGDEVVTSGGIYGNVQSVEGEAVILKISENVKVKVLRSAVTGIIGPSSK
ncbi:MAG TPA: preprotein translocase subunit YajC [Thermoanaerobaculia bacterium]|jgi:preprotein translocase subunit YajC